MRQVATSAIIITLALAAIAAGARRVPSADVPDALKVMTFNIQHGINGAGTYGLQAAIDTIAKVNPDLVGVQELTRNHPSYNCEDQPALIARGLSAEYPEISYHAANVLEWDCAQDYDISLCSLALHHFSDDDAAKLLRRCGALSKRFVLVSDLRRGFLLRAGVYMLTELIFREPMTRFDARLSAQRAFSFVEMRELAIHAGWKNFGHKKFQFSRQAVWLE